MKGIKELARSRPGDMTVVSGDTISLWYSNEKVLEETITEHRIFDECVVFEADASVFGRPALGGAFIEK